MVRNRYSNTFEPCACSSVIECPILQPVKSTVIWIHLVVSFVPPWQDLACLHMAPYAFDAVPHLLPAVPAPLLCQSQDSGVCNRWHNRKIHQQQQACKHINVLLEVSNDVLNVKPAWCDVATLMDQYSRSDIMTWTWSLHPYKSKQFYCRASILTVSVQTWCVACRFPAWLHSSYNCWDADSREYKSILVMSAMLFSPLQCVSFDLVVGHHDHAHICMYIYINVRFTNTDKNTH